MCGTHTQNYIYIYISSLATVLALSLMFHFKIMCSYCKHFEASVILDYINKK